MFFGHLAEHANDEHLVADAEQAGRARTAASATRLAVVRRWRGSGAAPSNHGDASRPHSKVERRRRPAVRASPSRGTSQNAAPSTPSTAPNVLLAYRPRWTALACRRRCAPSPAAWRPSPRSRAGAAGTCRRTPPTSATRRRLRADQVQQPVAERDGISDEQRRLHSADDRLARRVPAQRAARCARCAGRAASAPTASPPKNAATTASTAGGFVAEPQRASAASRRSGSRARRSRRPPSAASAARLRLHRADVSR